MSQKSFALVSVSTAIVWGAFFYPPPAQRAAPAVTAPAVSVVQEPTLQSTTSAGLDSAALTRVHAIDPPASDPVTVPKA